VVSLTDDASSDRLVWHTVSPPLWRVCATAPAAFLHKCPSPFCRKEPSKTLRTPFLVPCSWKNSLAIDDLDAQRSQLQQLRNQGKVYDSAMLDAMDANKGHGENMLPWTEVFGIHYPNLLIPVEEANEWHASGEHVDASGEHVRRPHKERTKHAWLFLASQKGL
jgi:hypothetical protein